MRLYNPQLKKLDSITISGFFIEYCFVLKDANFIVLPTKVIESYQVFYFKDDLDGGVMYLWLLICMMRTILPMTISPSPSIVIHSDRDDTVVENLVDIHVQPTMASVVEPVV